MCSQILGRNQDVFTFEELHFFEHFWAPGDPANINSTNAAIRFFSELLCIERNGYYARRSPETHYIEASKALLSVNNQYQYNTLFENFLYYETERNNKIIPCGQTPGNVFYMKEVFDFFPNARIINMIRDPRDVILSQKMKWRRRYFEKKEYTPIFETIRSWVHYHPVTTSKIWLSSIKAVEPFSDDDRVINIHYEALINNAEKSVRTLCKCLDLQYDPKMLEIPNVGSSRSVDDFNKEGVDTGKTGKWQKGGV